LIYTGTPAGVGEVQVGDVLEGFIKQDGVFDEGKPLLYCQIR